MKFQTKYNIIIWKSYFDKGFSITNYIKYPLAIFAMYEAVSDMDLTLTIWFSVFYCIFCFFFGWWWFKYGWMKAEIEVQNNFNMFVEQMRKAVKKKKFK